MRSLYPPSAFIPVTDETESNRSVQVVSGEVVAPRPQTAAVGGDGTRLQQNLRCGMVGGPPRGRGFQRQYDPLTSALDPETDP